MTGESGTPAAPAVIDAGLGDGAFFTTRRVLGAGREDRGGFNLSTASCESAAAVAANTAALAHAAGAPVGFMRQVHGREVAVVDAPGDRPEADALVTATAGLALAVLVADCVPVLLRGDNGAVGVAHAGRQGVEVAVIEAAVAALRSLGAGDVDAAIGPAICGRCYEVPADMRAEVAALVPAAAAQTSWGTPALDLPAAVAAQLADAGARVAFASTACTREDPALFSHRRDAPTGRQVGVIRCGAPRRVAPGPDA